MVDDNCWYWFFSWWMFYDVYWKLYHDMSGGFIITIYGDIDGWSSWFNDDLSRFPFLMFIIWWILMVDDNGWYWFFSWRMFLMFIGNYIMISMEKLWSLYMVILMVDEVDLIMVCDDLSWFPFWCLLYGEYWWLMIMVDTSSSHGECFMMFIGNYIMIFMEELWSLFMVILMVGQVDLKMVYDDLSRFFLMVNAYHGLHMMTKCVYIYICGFPNGRMDGI